jgi:large subunit ribosomal protein L22
MTGPKLNEGSRVAGERPGTRASARYVRMSASKARVVLDLVRGLPVREADQVLQLTEREAARVVRKVLASAVANAVNNDEQDADELFVLACFADEGPTLKRFSPRARGRAGRINKRTCHITVIVARMSDERIAIVEARAARTGRGAAMSDRRSRVERSRQRAAQRGSGAVEETTSDEQVVEDAVAEDAVVEQAAVEKAADDQPAVDEATAEVVGDEQATEQDTDVKKDEV